MNIWLRIKMGFLAAIPIGATIYALLPLLTQQPDQTTNCSRNGNLTVTFKRVPLNTTFIKVSVAGLFRMERPEYDSDGHLNIHKMRFPNVREKSRIVVEFKNNNKTLDQAFNTTVCRLQELGRLWAYTSFNPDHAIKFYFTTSDEAQSAVHPITSGTNE